MSKPLPGDRDFGIVINLNLREDQVNTSYGKSKKFAPNWNPLPIQLVIEDKLVL